MVAARHAAPDVDVAVFGRTIDRHDDACRAVDHRARASELLFGPTSIWQVLLVMTLTDVITVATTIALLVPEMALVLAVDGGDRYRCDNRNRSNSRR